MINNAPVLGRSMQDRVVSTSEWPVPYYQRIMKAYPVRGYFKRT